MHYASLSIKFYFLILLSCDATGALFPILYVVSYTLPIYSREGPKSKFQQNSQILFSKMPEMFQGHLKVLLRRIHYFEWSHNRMTSTDSKVQTALQVSSVHSETKGFNLSTILFICRSVPGQEHEGIIFQHQAL